MKPCADVTLRVEKRERGCFDGYAFDIMQLDRRLVIEALADGVPIACARADLYREDLAAQKVGDGCYGFVFACATSLAETADLIEIRVANRDDLPRAVLPSLSKITIKSDAEPGAVDWSGGLRFTGWLRNNGERTPTVYATLDGERIAEAPAARWRHVAHLPFAPQRGFELILHERFADGRVWSARFHDEEGKELAGSPVTFCAFHGGLVAELARFSDAPGQRPNAELFDRILPNVLPFAAYSSHRTVFSPRPEPGGTALWGVVIVDGEGIDATLASLEAQSHGHWSCAIAPASDRLSFYCSDLRDFLHSHAGGAEWALFLAPGAVLGENALARFDEAVRAFPEAALIYADWDLRDYEGRVWPVAHPAMDYERLLEQGYFAGAFALPRLTIAAAIEAGVDSLFRLANFAFDQAEARDRAVHLPGSTLVLPAAVFDGAANSLRRATQLHLARRGIAARVERVVQAKTPACRVRRKSSKKVSVSILIPTRNRHDLLGNCLQSISGAVNKARAEIIVIDNDSSDPQTLACFQSLSRQGVKILNAPGPFNFARINNLAAREASGDLLCFLNNDIEAQDDEWLDELLSRHVDENVGVVGAKLLWPSGVIQHGGVTLGVNFSPVHAFRDRLDGDPGYCGLLEAAHECGAVTAACMTTPRRLFLDSGGFDEIFFPIDFNDVDYCLKIAARGRRIVFTPHARLIHLEAASRGRPLEVAAAARF